MKRHWSDFCLGCFAYTMDTLTTTMPYKFYPWEGRPILKEHTAVYTPVEMATNQNCDKCNCHFDTMLGVQRHTIVRTKKGKRQGKLLWKHDGYITPKIVDPTVKVLAQAGPKYIYENKLPFILRLWRSQRTKGVDETIAMIKDISLNQYYKLAISSFSFWHPTQWTAAPTKENAVTNALERL